MTAAATAPSPTIAAPASPRRFPAAERAAIDASARGPVLFFFGNAILWLLLATVLGFIASIQLHSPEFLADIPFLTYGRIWPAYTNALELRLGEPLGHGCGHLAAGAALPGADQIPRRPRSPARVFWQVGLTYGIISILGGKTTGLEGLEIPAGSAALMLLGYLLVGLWGALLFGFRRKRRLTSPSGIWSAALFWFPWTFATAHAAHVLPAVSGRGAKSRRRLGHAEFPERLADLDRAGAAYYLIPKVINRPMHSYNLASIGFWSFILFAGLTGAVRLSGGPVPAWLVTLSIAASILLLVQIVTVTANLVLTMRGQYHMVYHSPTIRFTFFGAIAFPLASVIGLLASLRSVDQRAALHAVPERARCTS